MPKNEQRADSREQRVTITQKNIEFTGYKIADKIEDLIEKPHAASITSKAFDVEAPNGETVQVQIVVIQAKELFLPDHIEMVNYYEG
uniref:hypothetical protein n=1 Tax=uncultured Draconibacterium sp. TaxID=1573823 RepID=UPI0032175D71